MKILWFYQYMPHYNFDHFLHMDIAECMNGMQGIEMKCYGPGLHISNPNLCLKPHSFTTTLAELYEMFHFDVIVICTKSRMFIEYLPVKAYGNRKGEIRVGPWLPPDFATFHKGVRVVFEEDYHYEVDDNWYIQNCISIVFQRHYSNVEYGNNMHSPVKHIFLPFSIDPKIFFDRCNVRLNQISFVGSKGNSEYYFDRHKAVVMLERTLEMGAGKHYSDMVSQRPNKPMLLVSHGKLLDGDYVNNLNNYTCHLSGQCSYYILPSKIFEIAACGSVLFTNANPKSGIQQVLSGNSYVPWKDDFSDVVTQAQWIIRSPDAQRKIAQNAKNEIASRHTHEIRTKEFLEFMAKG